jgi:hypothetical protein
MNRGELTLPRSEARVKCIVVEGLIITDTEAPADTETERCPITSAIRFGSAMAAGEGAVGDVEGGGGRDEEGRRRGGEEARRGGGEEARRAEPRAHIYISCSCVRCDTPGSRTPINSE